MPSCLTLYPTKPTIFALIALFFLSILGPDHLLADNISHETTSKSIIIESVRDHNIITIETRGDGIRITFPWEQQTRTLIGQTTSKGKRKYTVSGYGLVAEVKPGQNGFKVRDHRGQLLWKVKRLADKTKISEDEEQSNPYELIHRDTGHIKIRRNNTRLGSVRWSNKAGTISVQDATGARLYHTDSPHFSILYGVLLLDDIPALERYIIMAEMWVRTP